MGRGSSLSGYMARKVQPDFMRHLELPKAGDFGLLTTYRAKYLAEFFRAHGAAPYQSSRANITQASLRHDSP